MAESTLSLRDYPQIIGLLSVLEQNGLHEQKQEVQHLVDYIESMEENMAHMQEEMRQMHSEMQRLRDRSLRGRCSQLVTFAEEKTFHAKAAVASVKSNLLSGCIKLLNRFEEKGQEAVQRMSDTLHIPQVLFRLQRSFGQAAAAMHQCAGRIELLRQELHESAEHVRNAGRVLLGKPCRQSTETAPDKGILTKLRILMESCSGVFSEMEKRTGRMVSELCPARSHARPARSGLRKDFTR